MYEKSGFAAIQESVERALLWGVDNTIVPPIIKAHGLIYSSALVDAGSTPTTDIRAGLIVGQVDSSSELEEWDADATDGTQEIYGVVPTSFSTLDENATAVDKIPPGPIVRGPLRASQLLIEGSAFVGHANEFLAREALHSMGIVLDDDPQGYLAGVNWRRKIHTGDLTLTSAMNATRFFCHSADAEFTLPTIKEGLRYEAFMSEDFELKFTSAETGNMVFGNDQTADAIAWTTAGEQIGAHILVEAVNIDIAGTNTLSWIIDIRKTAFSTDDFLAHTITT